MAHKQDIDELGSISRQLESITTDNQTTDQLRSQSSNVAGQQPSTGEILLSGNSLPAINCPEKVLFIIDRTRELDGTMYELGVGKKYAPLYLIRKALEVFILTKGSINKLHQYGIMALNEDTAEFVCNFTSNFKQLSSILDRLTDIIIQDVDVLDLSQCFEKIYESINLDPTTPIPVSCTRAILIYTRSKCVPTLTDTKYFEKLMQHPYFFLDSIYVHEPLSDDNMTERIYGELQRFDTKDNSYMLEVGRNPAQLYNTVVKLVSHPLQRPKQDDANYNIFLNEASSVV